MKTLRILALALSIFALISCQNGPVPEKSTQAASGAQPSTADAESTPSADEEIRILTWNLEWFNDHDTGDDQSTIGRDQAAPDAQEFQERVQTFAAAIAEMEPVVAALQEVENGKVVQALADEIRENHGLGYKVAFVEGRDSHTGQDVAFLVQEGHSFEADRFDFRPFRGRSEYKSLSKHLRLDLRLGDEEFTLVNVHLITRPGERVKQARMLRTWIQDLVEESVAGKRHVVVLGDCNTKLAFQETTPESEMGVLRGFGTAQSEDDLYDTQERMGDRSTHVTGQPLDRILLSASLNDGKGLDLAKIETRRDLAIRGKDDFSRDGVDYSRPQTEQDLSDHYPLLATLSAR